MSIDSKTLKIQQLEKVAEQSKEKCFLLSLVNSSLDSHDENVQIYYQIKLPEMPSSKSSLDCSY